MTKAAKKNSTPARARKIADPIYTSIAAREERLRAIDRTLKRFKPGKLADERRVQAALQAECTAAKALIETAPRTRAGLLALEGHLRGDAGRGVIHFIKSTVTIEEFAHIADACRRDSISLCDGANRWVVDAFIAQRAAEIGEA